MIGGTEGKARTICERQGAIAADLVNKSTGMLGGLENLVVARDLAIRAFQFSKNDR